MQSHSNADKDEIKKFEELANQWWDKNSDLKTLHDINPLRLKFINDRCALDNKTVVDVGCGGGILSESMAKLGAKVTGIDLAQASLAVAKLHQTQSHVEIDYQLIAVEDLAAQQPLSFDVVTCMELLEHVPDPAAVISACAALAKAGGSLFFSTLNRTPLSYLQAIIGAEYLLRLLPIGTHDYAKFIKPSELTQWARATGLEIQEIKGMSYNPLTQFYGLTTKPQVNYLVFAQKPQDQYA